MLVKTNTEIFFRHFENTLLGVVQCSAPGVKIIPNESSLWQPNSLLMIPLKQGIEEFFFINQELRLQRKTAVKIDNLASKVSLWMP